MNRPTAQGRPPSGPDDPIRWDCRHLRGDRPCRARRSCAGCPEWQPATADVLLVQLGALGDVVRSTALLPAIRRAFPGSRLTWLTSPRAAPLLDHLAIDRVIVAEPGIDSVVAGWGFDVALGADRDPRAAALTRAAGAKDTRGFVLGRGGIVGPANPEAELLHRLGIDDGLRLQRAPASEPELRAAALGLPWGPDCVPRLVLTSDESALAARLRSAGPLVGWNTGASHAYKRWTREDQVAVMRAAAAALPGARFALLGGPEDAADHYELAQELADLGLVRTPTDGLRRGAAAVAACSVIVTGDTLALHLAIALGVPAVAWFGPTPEVDVPIPLGIAVPSTVGCRPCWRSSCDREPKCFRTLPWGAIPEALRGILGEAPAGGPRAP